MVMLLHLECSIIFLAMEPFDCNFSICISVASSRKIDGGEKAMTKSLPENLKGYPENRMYGKENPAGGLYIRHADNILIENFHIRQRNHARIHRVLELVINVCS